MTPRRLLPLGLIVTTVVLASGSAYSGQAIQRNTVGTKQAKNNPLTTGPILSTIDHRHIP